VIARIFSLSVLTLCSCHAFVDDYAVSTDASTEVTDTAPATTDAADASDARYVNPNARTCIGLKATSSPGLPSGPYDLVNEGTKLPVYCDMTTAGGGFILVATRSSKTAHTVWASGEGLIKDKPPMPDLDEDRIIDLDWPRVFAISEVAYEIDDGTKVKRVAFSQLLAKHVAGARAALSTNVLLAERPPCRIDGAPSVENCSTTSNPLGSGEAYGWLFNPAAEFGSCFFAHLRQKGAGPCNGSFPAGGAKARVWVR